MIFIKIDWVTLYVSKISIFLCTEHTQSNRYSMIKWHCSNKSKTRNYLFQSVNFIMNYNVRDFQCNLLFGQITKIFQSSNKVNWALAFWGFGLRLFNLVSLFDCPINLYIMIYTEAIKMTIKLVSKTYNKMPSIYQKLIRNIMS